MSSRSEQEERPRELSERFNEKFALLASDRCRITLQVLREMDDEFIEFSDLATAIVAREDNDHTLERDKVIIDLHHRQLPKLVDAEVVEYDQRSGIVRYHGDERIEALIQAMSEKETF